jgi:biotin carboxyl carrier protein
MKYTAILNETEREIEITPLENHRFEVIIDNNTHIVDARDCGPERLSILVDNVSHDISYAIEEHATLLNFRNRYFSIQVLDERRMRMKRVRNDLDLSGPEIIKTTMPGKVVKVLVEPGQEVSAGTGVIIIEAMKMENEIRCRNDGMVKAIHVQAGQTVEGNITLIEIEPLPE